LLGIGISLGLIALLVSQIDFALIKTIDISFKPGNLAAIMVVVLLQFMVISYRWSVINQIGFAASFKSSVIAYGANMLLPARGGDVLRMAYLKKARHSGVTTGVFSLIIEKTADLVAMLLILSLWFAYFKNELNMIVLVPGAIGLALMLFLYTVLFHERKLKQLLAILMRKDGVLKRVAQIIAQRIDAIDLHYQRRDYVKIVCVTLLIWLIAYPAFYLLAFDANEMPLALNEVFLLMAITGLGLALPSAPSGIGVFHAAAISTLLLVGYQYENALIAATVVHLLITLPVIVYALITYYYLLMMGDHTASHSLKHADDA